MILIDTNVVSELMRPTPAPAVRELRAGAAYLPAGRRRERLTAAIDAGRDHRSVES